MSLFEQYVHKKELQEFNQRVEKYGKEYGDLKVIGEVDGWPIHHIVVNPKGTRTICFIAGIHGDEIGGPYGVLEFLKKQIRIPESVRLEIIPLANPTGFVKRTRENAAGIDINRQFYEQHLLPECQAVWDTITNSEIELLHTLHEDLDQRAFYLYYTHHKTLAGGLRDDVAKKYFSIHENKELYGDKANEGLIPLPHTKRDTVEDRALEEQNIPYITTETPGKATLKNRAMCNRDMIKYVIHSFS